MSKLTAKEIKKIMYGIILSDGHIDTKNQRFEFYTKSSDFCNFVADVLRQISGVHVNYKYDAKNIGHRIWTRKHPYFKNIGDKCYSPTRKELNAYNVSRLDPMSLAMMWVCDGYLEHAKNRKTNKIQNIGWFCLEAFPKNELELFQKHLMTFGVNSSLVKKPWGFGFRVRIGGEDLQKFISLIYDYVHPDYLYKTILFYKSEKNFDMSLPSAGHILQLYEDCEDIVRHPLKKGTT